MISESWAGGSDPHTTVFHEKRQLGFILVLDVSFSASILCIDVDENMTRGFSLSSSFSFRRLTKCWFIAMCNLLLNKTDRLLLFLYSEKEARCEFSLFLDWISVSLFLLMTSLMYSVRRSYFFLFPVIQFNVDDHNEMDIERRQRSFQFSIFLDTHSPHHHFCVSSPIEGCNTQNDLESAGSILILLTVINVWWWTEGKNV
jgi:hypothetical protein